MNASVCAFTSSFEDASHFCEWPHTKHELWEGPEMVTLVGFGCRILSLVLLLKIYNNDCISERKSGRGALQWAKTVGLLDVGTGYKSMNGLVGLLGEDA